MPRYASARSLGGSLIVASCGGVGSGGGKASLGGWQCLRFPRGQLRSSRFGFSRYRRERRRLDHLWLFGFFECDRLRGSFFLVCWFLLARSGQFFSFREGRERENLIGAGRRFAVVIAIRVHGLAERGSACQKLLFFGFQLLFKASKFGG